MWIKTVKWLALVAGALGVVYCIYNLGHSAGSSMSDLKLADYKEQAYRQQLELWHRARDAQKEANEAEERFINATSAHEKATSDLVADYERGVIRLRKSLTCSSASGRLPEDSSTGGGDATSGRGLQRRDVENLIRIADRADRVAEQLTACQEVIRSATGG